MMGSRQVLLISVFSVLAVSILMATRLVVPPDDLRPKIFVIGLSKTGTTSVGDALAQLGYRRLGWMDVLSRHLVHTYLHGDLAPLISLTSHFDAFEDLPWPYVYQEMAEMYPDSKFILSLRKDEKTWLESIRRHNRRHFWGPNANFYGGHYAEGHEAAYLDSYHNHTALVRDYFKDKPERYAELVIDDSGSNWKVICRIAKCAPNTPLPSSFPRSNSAAGWHDGDFRALPRWLWIRSVRQGEDWIAYAYYTRNWPLVRLILDKMAHAIVACHIATDKLFIRIQS